MSKQRNLYASGDCLYGHVCLTSSAQWVWCQTTEQKIQSLNMAGIFLILQIFVIHLFSICQYLKIVNIPEYQTI